MRATVLTRFAAPFFWASRGERVEFVASDLQSLLGAPELWPGETGADLAETRLTGWSGAVFRDDARVVRDDMAEADPLNRLRLDALHTLIVDYEDDPAADGDHLERWWAVHHFVAWTSAWHGRPWRNRPAGPRWRLLLPLDRPASLEEGEELARWVRHPRHGVGMVSADVERVWRVCAGPAMNPGGFHFRVGEGEPVRVEAALAELAGWRDQDRRATAVQVLGDGAMEPAVRGFGRRLSERVAPTHASVWPGPPQAVSPGALRAEALPEAAATLGVDPGGPRPGRLSVLVGPGASGRAALALQIAANQAAAGFPALYVSTRTTVDESLARLLALRARGPATAEGVLARAADAADLSAALAALVRELPTLTFWTPGAGDRDGSGLAARVKATSDLAGGRPPLVVLDALEAWDGPEDRLAAALFDVLRPDTLGPGWPGAEVLALGRMEGGVATSLPTGPVANEASRVLEIRLLGEAGSAVRPAELRVLRDRLGSPRSVSLTFEGARGRFTHV